MNDQNKPEQTQEAATSGEPAPTSTVPVENLHDFVGFLTRWHTTKVAELRHMIEMPEGITMITGEGDEQKSTIMEGVMLAGFKAGIELALMQLGTLPFRAELEDVEVH